MPALRDITENCPVCILAAIRQSGIDSWLFDFKYKEEHEAWWKEHNESPASYYE